MPAHLIDPGDGEPWPRVDWLAVAAWYLNGEAERLHETASGPIHSYSLRLTGWDPRVWEHAWVNRIALWLRLWAQESDPDVGSALGPLPRGEILLTHDVDAIRKTLATRSKQTAFNGFNAIRSLVAGEIRQAAGRATSAVQFATSGSDYWRIPEMCQLEDERGWRSVFNFFAGPDAAGRTAKRRLMDPAYDPNRPPVREELSRLLDGGWGVGLHPSYDSWEHSARIAREREALSLAARHEVRWCRQHWLRFSWARTWAAQAAAGIELDMSLGFNDRPGFRNGAALAFRPIGNRGPVSLPMVFMDAHLYDYQTLTAAERTVELDRLLGEIRDVRGQASLVWHQRVLSNDYGWDYAEPLDAIERNDLSVLAPDAALM